MSDDTDRSGNGETPFISVRRFGKKWVPWLVGALTFLAMARLCTAEFTWWDDGQTIHHNPRLNPPTWEGVRYYWRHAYMGLYVPVTYSAWSGLAAIAQLPTADENGIALNPYVFHTANVLVHVVNALVVYAILKRAVKNPWAAGMGAMVFGVHPVQVETVGWVSGMKDLLCGTFVLLSVWQYVIYAQATKAVHPRDRRWCYWGALACAGIGTLCKPTAVVAPLLLAGVDRWIVGRSWREVGRAVWPFALAVLPCITWTKMVQDVTSQVPMWAKPLVAGDAVAFYMCKIIWPANLAADYGRNPAYAMGRWWFWVTWGVPAVVAGILWLGRQRRPMLMAAGWLFVGGLAPVLGFLPFMFQSYSTVADHYLYLPMLGFAVGTAWVVATWPSRQLAVGAVCILVAMVARSVTQAGVWHDDESLARHGLAVNGRSFGMRLNLANTLDVRAERSGDTSGHLEAERLLREALAIRPSSIAARQALAVVLLELGKEDEGIGLLRENLRLWQTIPASQRSDEIAPTYFTLGLVMEKRGDYQQGLEEMEHASAEGLTSRELNGAIERVRGKIAKAR